MGSVDAFNIEAWSYLAIDIVIVFTRVFGRWKRLGLRGLSPDDFLMIIALLLYTAETATAYWVGAFWQGLANSEMTDEERAALDPLGHEYHLRVKGSQTQLFGWAVYSVLLWTLKLCWLFFYKRLGDGVDNMTIKINVGFVVVIATFFITFFTIIFGCYPVEKHWQINPDPGNFCQPAVSKLQAWTLIITNLSTDFYIMSIPMPMVWNARIPIFQKLGLVSLFCGGILTAVFGGLRCGFILQNSMEGPQLAGEWSCRESFVAVFISNVPILLPMLHRSFQRVREMTSSLNNSRSGEGKGSGNRVAFKMGTLSGKAHDKKKFKHPLSLPGETFYERYGSEEDIIENHGPIPGSKEGFPEQQQQQEMQMQMQMQQMQQHQMQQHQMNMQMQQATMPCDITVTTEWQVESRTMDSAQRQHELHQTVNGYQARQSQCQP
ncbi:hypothetical protein ESCO_001508 [Escovopsis weberi]|uniref:Rhodopsin domain-containing protein n=1 Tax=Escovopsis weberi TaxID=150374 RepID=A0A0M8N2D4_ESCWE|nr:hypothetical protein ESCO_001508 [Escovopsis weberi]